jgi:hypothetical protein
MINKKWKFYFNNKIIDVVRTHKDQFINEFLQGNINISTAFNSLSSTTSVTGLAYEDGNGELNSKNTSGTLTLNDGNKLKGLYIDGKYSTDSNGNLTINIGKARRQPIDVIINEPEDQGGEYTQGENTQGRYGPGGPEYITATDINPRCKYQPKCTINHAHFKKCKTQLYADNNGGTYCKCICEGPVITNGEPHGTL